MAFTLITITANEVRPDGTVPIGTVTATLSQALTNGTQLIEPTPVVGDLNASGHLVNQSGLAFALEANDDTATTPAGSSYQFLIELDNAPVREFSAVVPHAAAAGTIDLSVLEATKL